MVSSSKLCCWSRRVDPDQALLISAVTYKRYEDAFSAFVSWIVRNNHNPCSAQHLDSLIVSYKNDVGLSKSAINYVIASTEFFLPQVKNRLIWARKVAAGQHVSAPTKHTAPMVSKVSSFYGARLATSGMYRMGLYIAVQQAVGLRPSEGLKLKAKHVLRPEFACGKFLLRLGANVGTKIKREQVAHLDPAKHPILCEVFADLLDHTSPDEHLFPFSYSAYNNAIQNITATLNVDVHFTAHSPRAGFASENIALGEPPEAIRLLGRWSSEQNFKIYIDVISAAHISALVNLAGHSEAMLYCHAHFNRYFPKGVFALKDCHAASVCQRPGNKPVHTSNVALARRQAAKRQPSRHARAATEAPKGQGKAKRDGLASLGAAATRQDVQG